MKNISRITISFLLILCLLPLCACGDKTGRAIQENQNTAVINDDPGTVGKDLSSKGMDDAAVSDDDPRGDGTLHLMSAVLDDHTEDEEKYTAAVQVSDTDYSTAWEDGWFSGSENSVMSDQPGSDIAAFALQFNGYPYVTGGISPETGFDCSGFVYYCLNSTGHPAPRVGQDQYDVSQHVGWDELRPGDLVFFVGTYDTEGISHVGIYIGGGKMIDAEIEDVRIAWLDSEYWQEHFYGLGRIE